MNTDYQNYIALSRYSRYIPSEQRRERWEETVTRYCDFWKDKHPDSFPYEEVKQSISSLKVMPSMRALMTAGKALDRDNVAGYNCSYMAVDNQRCFDEALYLLMCGVGVGYSVERQFISKLPVVSESFYPSDTVISVRDSRIGWASALRELISLLYQGQVPKWDVSKVRPSGVPLKTFGGRSSGPQPLVDVFNYFVATFKGSAGRKLNSLEVNDLMCKISMSVVSGGVRRSACICLTNLSDLRMRDAKSGQWYIEKPERSLANISVAYTEKPDIGQFMQEWLSLYNSKAGERGIFNRVAAIKKVEKYGKRKVEPIEEAGGTNPCGEIVLRSCSFCNLTEVVVRNTDTVGDLLHKVEVAAILGTFQATLTDFRYLRSVWSTNTEEERLLGVSLTGLMDHPMFNSVENMVEAAEVLDVMRNVVVRTNAEWAEKLGINPAAATTTVKPSGTVSQLVDSSSGIHPRYSKYYIRRVRNDKKDPLSSFLISQGVPYEEDVHNKDMYVFSFPMAAPEGARTTEEVSAIEQLHRYLLYNEYWSEHSISITVYVKEHEWLKVGAWVYQNFDKLNGVSFLPHSDHIYKQAPYESIDEEEFIRCSEEMPKIDWSAFTVKEYEDVTAGIKEFACTAGGCELV